MNGSNQYRICENIDGKFKVQMLKKISVFGFILYKYWKDILYEWLGYWSLEIFDSYEEAQKELNITLEEEKKQKQWGGEWKCKGIIS